MRVKVAFVLMSGLALALGAYKPPEINIPFKASEIKALSMMSDVYVINIIESYRQLLEYGHVSSSMQQTFLMLRNLHTKKDIFIMPLNSASTHDQVVVCAVCRAAVSMVAQPIRSPIGILHDEKAGRPLAKLITLDMCRRLQLQTHEVCEGLFDIFYQHIHYIIKHSTAEPRTICSHFMEYSFCNVADQEAYNWSLPIDPNGPPVDGPKDNLPPKSPHDLRVLHLTDIHYDPLYVSGSLAECDEPLCCHRDPKEAKGSNKTAGYWGDYRDCDLPWHTVDQSLKHMSRTHGGTIDYIYHTGDIIDHMMWATSRGRNLDAVVRVEQRLQQTFPKVPIYPCIGNHEPHPVNLFSPPNVSADLSNQWLYERLYEVWSLWLPASTKETILRGGYYTVSPRPGFRIISVNSNFCYLFNLWLFLDGSDKLEQLRWLHDTLLEAERASEYVHILSHVPSGDPTCWSVWAREFARIVERFHHIIGGIFNGHTHEEEMNVYYSSGGHAVGLAWNAGSLTPYNYKNPNYRVYQVDPKTYQVVDSESWIFRLNEANDLGSSVKPRWLKEYVFSEEFTANMSPGGIDRLLDEMATNPDKLFKYWEYKMTSAQPRLDLGCHRYCLTDTIRRLATTVNDQVKRSDELEEKLRETLSKRRLYGTVRFTPDKA